MKDYYKHLGLSRLATESEIKAAYRKLAIEHHPDKNGNPVLFHAINEAYEVLGDPLKRKSYDERRNVALVDDLEISCTQIVEEFFGEFKRTK